MEEPVVPLAAETVLGELHQLWAELAMQAESPGAHGVVRACSLTLIVFDEQDADDAALGLTLAEVTSDHPNRAIVVRVPAGTPGALDHRVSAQCWMPAGQRQQICSEQIEITAGEQVLGQLRPLLTALTAPDLPVVVWCRAARLLGSPAFQAALPFADKLIVDSAAFPDAPAILKTLAAGQPPAADLAWTRLTGWRQTLALAFETVDLPPAALRRIREVRVYHTGESVPSAAYYFAGWVLASLNPEGSPAVKFEAVEGEPRSPIEGVRLVWPEAQVTLRRVEGFAVLIEALQRRDCALCPPRPDAELLREELSITGRDPIYDQALRAAVKL